MHIGKESGQVKALKKRRKTKMKNKANITTLDQILDKKYGKKGASEREKWGQDFETFGHPYLTQQGLIVEDDFDKEWNDPTNLTIEEARANTLAYIDTLPLKK